MFFDSRKLNYWNYSSFLILDSVHQIANHIQSFFECYIPDWSNLKSIVKEQFSIRIVEYLYYCRNQIHQPEWPARPKAFHRNGSCPENIWLFRCRPFNPNLFKQNFQTQIYFDRYPLISSSKNLCLTSYLFKLLMIF